MWTEATTKDLEAAEETTRVKLREEASLGIMVLWNLTSLMVWIS